MAKGYSFTDEQIAYIAKMAKARGIEEKEAAQNLMDKGISRDKALSKYSGATKPKAKAKSKSSAKPVKKQVRRGRPPKSAQAASKPGRKARATISQPRPAAIFVPPPAVSVTNGASTHAVELDEGASAQMTEG
jgi:hypothetical protein